MIKHTQIFTTNNISTLVIARSTGVVKDVLGLSIVRVLGVGNVSALSQMHTLCCTRISPHTVYRRLNWSDGCSTTMPHPYSVHELEHGCDRCVCARQCAYTVYVA